MRAANARLCGFLTGAAGGQGPDSCRCAPSGFPCRCFAPGAGVNSPDTSRLGASVRLRHARPLTPPPQSTRRGLLNVAQPLPTGYALAAELTIDHPWNANNLALLPSRMSWPARQAREAGTAQEFFQPYQHLRKRPSTQTVPAALRTQFNAACRVAGLGRSDFRGRASGTRREPEWADERSAAAVRRAGRRIGNEEQDPAPTPGTRQQKPRQGHRPKETAAPRTNASRQSPGGGFNSSSSLP